MEQFKDTFGHDVRIAFGSTPFSTNPKHVWVICRYNDQWLLTEHKHRGLEFPGGKVEANEAPADAAKREVFEETGGVVDSLTFVGQYEVTLGMEVIVKNIYFARIDSLSKESSYYETKGPILLKHLPSSLITDDRFSFIMKDLVWVLSYEKICEEGFC